MYSFNDEFHARQANAVNGGAPGWFGQTKPDQITKSSSKLVFVWARSLRSVFFNIKLKHAFKAFTDLASGAAHGNFLGR